MVKRTEVPAEFRQDSGPTASEPQLAWAKKLREGKDLSKLAPNQVKWLMEADFDTYPSELPKKRLGDVIEKLVSLPWKKRTAQQSDDLGVGLERLPDGRYGVENVPGHKNQVSFFRYRTPKNGDWAGYQFCDQIVGHGKRFPVKGEARTKVTELIRKQGVVECLQRFGKEFNHCGRCGRELTDDLSRARGIGPDCWGILGM